MSEQNHAVQNRPRPQRHHGPGGPGFGMPVEKAKNFKASLRRLLSYLKPYRLKIIIVMFFAVASMFFAIWAPKVSGWAVTNLAEGVMSKSVVNAVEKMQDATASAAKKQETAFKAEMTRKQNEMQIQSDEITKTGNELKAEQAQLTRDAAALKKTEAQLRQGQADLAAAQAKLGDQTSRMNALKTQMGEKSAQLAGMKASPSPDAAQMQALQTEIASLGAQMQQLGAAMQQEGAAMQQKGAELKAKAAQLQKDAAALKSKGEALKAEGEQLQQKVNALKAEGEAIQKQVEEAKKQASAMPSIPSMKDAKTNQDKAQVFKKLVQALRNLTPEQLASMKKMSGGNGASGIDSVRKMSAKDIDSMVKAIADTGGKINFVYIWYMVRLLILLYLISALCTFVQQFLMSTVAQDTVYHLRRDLNDKFARLPLKYYDSRTHGEILSRMTNDIDTISTTLQQSITQVISSVVQIIGYIVMMVTISPLLTLIVLASLPLYVAVTMLIAKQSQKYFAAQQKELGDLSGHVEEMYTGHKIVKAFGYEQKSEDKFAAVNKRLYGAGWKAQFISGVMFPMMNFISNLAYVGIAVVGGIFVTKKALELGDITAFIQYSKSFTQPIIQTANIANVIQSTIACAERVFEVLDEKEEIPDAADAKVLSQPHGEVRFEHVRFGYADGSDLIGNMNIEVKQGETIAIVGPTGAGKTTIVNLLMRFYEIRGGRILVDGVDIRNIKRDSLRSAFGMVLQDTWLFNGTIYDNIAYGKSGATEEEIVTAARTAHADHFIRTLPDGYGTVLNEEASNISQGQKQLLTIARAFLADPAILILDEATSSVDTRTETLIQKAMSVLMKGRTNFVIAHRLSTIRDAGTILVMNHGSIVESGSHRELLEKGGFYADLYNSQFLGAAVQE